MRDGDSRGSFDFGDERGPGMRTPA